MPKMPLPHRLGSRPSLRSLRRLPGLLAALLLAACASAAGPPVPEALRIQDSDEKLALHAEATDGCAFAGTWSYQAELPDGHVEGLIVVRNRGSELDGMHRFSAREKAGTPALATCPYETCELCVDGDVCASRFYITAGVEQGGRAAAGGAVNPEVGTHWTRLLLSEDGQSLEISFWTPLRFVTTEAQKVQGAACEADFDYVRRVAGWANKGYTAPVLGVQ